MLLKSWAMPPASVPHGLHLLGLEELGLQAFFFRNVPHELDHPGDGSGPTVPDRVAEELHPFREFSGRARHDVLFGVAAFQGPQGGAGGAGRRPVVVALEALVPRRLWINKNQAERQGADRWEKRSNLSGL
jgi:hypothetical protein